MHRYMDVGLVLRFHGFDYGSIAVHDFVCVWAGLGSIVV